MPILLLLLSGQRWRLFEGSVCRNLGAPEKTTKEKSNASGRRGRTHSADEQNALSETQTKVSGEKALLKPATHCRN